MTPKERAAIFHDCLRGNCSEHDDYDDCEKALAAELEAYADEREKKSDEEWLAICSQTMIQEREACASRQSYPHPQGDETNKEHLKELIAALYAYHRIASGAKEHNENEFPYKCQICSLINRTEALL